jgi:glycosyltransferase involved in cell wall biosynthesis
MDIVGGISALSGGLPWVVTERTSAPYYEEVPLTARLRLLLGRFASAVVANSEGGEKYWRAAEFPAARLATVRNALDVESIRNAVAADLPEAVPDPVLLVVGRLNHAKAFDIIIKAVGELSKHSAVNVLIIGEGPERAALEHEIEAAAVSGCVRISSYQPDWWRWLGRAAGLISMSRYEGNPNVVLEAMAGCCPVILSDIPAHREIADEASALFVPVDDVQALSAAMVTLLGGKDAARERAERAFVRVGSMTVTAMADAYEATYRKILNGTN